MNPDDILAALSACWCGLLATSLGGAPATCCIAAGNPSVADCCAGFAWVRFTGSYPSTTFPTMENRPSNCLTAELAMQVEVGITRCAPAPCDLTENICCDAEAAANTILMDDSRLLRKLFQCGCIGLPNSAIIMGPTKVYGPEGGCLGVLATATLRATNF